MKPFSLRQAAVSLIASGVLMVGSADPSSIAEVTGTITYGGKPVSGVSVQLVPKDGKSPLGRGTADESGRYTIGRAMGKKGCAAGAYSVRLSEQDPGSQQLNIPEEMSMKSTLTLDVKPGRNTFDIEIPGPKSPSQKK
jgi:hypothetical protein